MPLSNLPQTELHDYYTGSVEWCVTPFGIGIAGAAPAGTAGPPVTARRVWNWFGAEIAAAASASHVAPEVLVAIICNESAGGGASYAQVVGARREEPGYVSDQATPGKVSTGCCQTLLSTARQALRRPGLSSQDLEHPATSIQAAASCIASEARQHAWDPVLIAACYNAGGLYKEPFPMNRWMLKCWPLNSGGYIDDFVAWHNDAVAVLHCDAK